MYYLSEKTNLKSLDKALSVHTSKFGTFGHKMLSVSEIKAGSNARRKAEESKEDALAEIW